jgi:hypothetical protein
VSDTPTGSELALKSAPTIGDVIDHLRAENTSLREEIARLNKWADSFSDAQLHERQMCDAHNKELQQQTKVAREQLRLAQEQLKT